MAATRKAVEEFSPISPQRRECGTFPLLFFLEMIHISLKEGLLICRGHECRCELFIYLFPQISLHLGVYLHFPKIFTLGSVYIYRKSAKTSHVGMHSQQKHFPKNQRNKQQCTPEGMHRLPTHHSAMHLLRTYHPYIFQTMHTPPRMSM